METLLYYLQIIIISIANACIIGVTIAAIGFFIKNILYKYIVKHRVFDIHPSKVLLTKAFWIWFFNL